MLRLRARVEEHTKVNDTFSNINQGEEPEEPQPAPDSESSQIEQAIYKDYSTDRPRAGWPNLDVANPSKIPPTLWLGVLIRESFTPAYLCKRDVLADASNQGHWETVLESLDEGNRNFNEAWPNAVRLRMLRTLKIYI